MVSLTANELISHQAYSEHRERLIGIEEDSADITHFVNFHLNDNLELIARVQHRLENPKIPSDIIVKEDKIYCLSERVAMIHGSGVPRAAVPLPETLQRWDIISKISHRTIVIFDIVIDQKYYEKLNNFSKSLDPSLVNKTYILMAPAPIEKAWRIPLNIQDLLSESFSSDDSQQSRKEEVLDEVSKTPPPSPLKLHLSPTPEADL